MATNVRLYDHQVFAARADQVSPSEPQAPEIERAIGKKLGSRVYIPAYYVQELLGQADRRRRAG